MCGIAGIITWDPACDFTPELLRAMSAAIAHRGPDGEGIFTNHDGPPSAATPRVGFVHRRLSVIDPNPRSNQPFTIGTATIVFNGEIYNYLALRAELSAARPEYEWRTAGDTEVLLMSYLVWGDACRAKLNGMYVAAVWNEATKSVWMARDRMGQKPLYAAFKRGTHVVLCDDQEPYYHPPSPTVVAFASEPRALQALGWWNHDVVDPVALMEYLRWGHTQGLSLQKGIEQLDPETSDEFPHRPQEGDSGHRRRIRGLSDADAVRETRACVTTAVHRQLVSDVPLGCFLSGGIDSSIIALCARQAGPLETFSCGFEGDATYDESAYAAAVAKHLGTKHHAFVVTPDAAADLPKIAASMGEPFGDSSILPTYYLSRETRKHVTVALDGTGGDELFGGYDRYVALWRAAQLDKRLPRWVRRALGSMATVLPGTHPKGRLARFKRFARGLGQTVGERYAGYTQIFDDAMIAELTGEKTLAGARGLTIMGNDPVRAALAFDRGFYLPYDLLTKTDRASMMHALEVRSPFMDSDVVDLAEGLTTDQLLRGGKKRMLREAFAKDLPAEVFTRRKMGFAVPIGAWFRGSLREMLHENLLATDSFTRANFALPAVKRLLDEHDAGKADHAQRLFALLMLELWWRGR